jgi:cytochrome P450
VAVHGGRDRRSQRLTNSGQTRDIQAHFHELPVSRPPSNPQSKVRSSTRGSVFGADHLRNLLLVARASGLWTQKQFRDNLNVLFVASQENPQIALISTMYLLARHPKVQEKLFGEISSSGDGDLETLPYLTATIYESLRLYPPISQLINRLTTQPAALVARSGEQIVIPPGTYVGYHAYCTNRDPDVWGCDADEFKPERWGSTVADIQGLYRRVRAKGGFVTFHGGRRACLGEKFAMLELRVAISGLVRCLVLSLDGTEIRMTPVSTGRR